MKTRIIKRKGTLLSSVAMLSTAMLLTACGGDGGDSPVDDGGANPGESGAQALLYAYPDNGQGEVSTAAPVVLRFSSAVNLGEAQNSITVYEGDAQSGTVVAVTPESVAGEPNNVLLQPDEDLKPNQAYTVVIEDLRLRRGTAKDQTLTFTTRPLHEGPKSLVVKEDTFEVSRRMPDGSDMEPVMDFSSFRFQFTQPIDRATAMYGDGNTVVLRDGAGDPVDATLLIDGAYMTVDPDQEYLNAGETYTLDITAGLASTYGETLGDQSYTLTPKDSSPKGEPAILVQKLTQGTTSRLTGKPVNEVPVNGTLLGENKNITQASAEVVRAELADVTTYTDVTPIRLPKGTVLNGAEINPILIGGEVNAGFGSGDVTMTVLSDASGYLVPNPYAGNNPNALRIVHLLMDVGIATSEARANGAFTQDLLHIELVGLAEVDPTAGVLNLDAVSVVEPNILGQEYGYGMLSFQLQSYKDQNNTLESMPDMQPPQVQSVNLGIYSSDNGDFQKDSLLKSDDPIIINFNEPISAKDIGSKVTMEKNGAELSISSHVDGSSLVIEPIEEIERGTFDEPVYYTVNVEAGVRDIAGNPSEVPYSESFQLAKTVSKRNPVGNPNASIDSEARALIILAAYPGYPCALDVSEIDLAADDMGRCDGSFPGWNQGQEPYDIKPEDDHLPVMGLPANRSIKVTFSRNLDPESVTLGETFTVNQVDENGVALANINGELIVQGSSISFMPESPWQPGSLYSYTLKSNGDRNSSSADCSGIGSICGQEGLPIQTSLFAELNIQEIPENEGSGPLQERDYRFLTQPPIQPGSGGPDFVQYFRGQLASDNIIQSLHNLPSYDTNSNFIHENNLDITDGATFAQPIIPLYEYESEEMGASGQPLDPNANSDLDPNGVLPPPNSAKVVSRDTKGQSSENGQILLNGANIGCGYQETLPYDAQNLPGEVYGVPLECPEQKFTYLTGALNAEVTNEYVQGKGLKVLIWPSQIMSTSLNIRQHFGISQIFITTESGPQILRMRYGLNESGTKRDQPIVAWIHDVEGSPYLSAKVDLYMDAIALSPNVPVDNPTHALISYPITMELRGPVRFLADGRMLIEQWNQNDVNLDVAVHSPAGNLGGIIKLTIPAFGSRLQYVSEQIK